MKIIQELNNLGLAPKAARVYLAIIELGKASSIDIARRTRLKRTTVYDHVLDLIQRGYITETKKGKRRLFIAEDPKKLIGRHELRLERIKELVPILSSAYTKNHPQPHIRFYDGFSGVRVIMEELLTAQKEEQLWWTSMHDMADVLGRNYLKQWVRRRVKRGISCRVLRTPETAKTLLDPLFGETTGYLRKIKWLPVNFVFEGALCIFNDKVAYMSSRNDRFGFIIESASFSKMHRLVFESMWMVTPEKASSDK